MFNRNLKQAKLPHLPATTNGTEAGVVAEQQQRRRRTAIRIVGIEGIEGFTELLTQQDAVPRKKIP